MIEPTCERCLQALSPQDVVESEGAGIAHVDCRRPRDLTPDERSLLYRYCWEHPIACPACAQGFRLFELDRTPFEYEQRICCPRCQAAVIESVRDHLYACQLAPEALRQRAQETREHAPRLVKRARELRDRADVLMREAEVIAAESRDAAQQSAGSGWALRGLQILRAVGVRGLLAGAAQHRPVRPRMTIRCNIFFEADLLQADPMVPSRLPLTIRPARFDELAAFARELTIAGTSPAEVLRRHQQGEQAIFAFTRNQLVHVRWLVLRSLWLPDVGVTLQLAPSEAYAHNEFTFPEFRGQRVSPAVKSFCLQWLRSLGYTREIVHVHAANFPSLAVQKRVGYRPTKTVWSFFRPGHPEPFVLLGARKRGSPFLVPGRPMLRPSLVNG